MAAAGMAAEVHVDLATFSVRMVAWGELLPAAVLEMPPMT